MITVNDLRNYPNGEELITKVNNGDLTLGQAAILAVQASNPERSAADLLINAIKKNNGNYIETKTATNPMAKAIDELINAARR